MPNALTRLQTTDGGPVPDTAFLPLDAVRQTSGLLEAQIMADPGDASVAYLITHWSSRPAMQGWIERFSGLNAGDTRLNSTFTQSGEPERDPSEAPLQAFARVLVDRWTHFLSLSSVLHLLVLDRDGSVLALNRAAEAFLAGGDARPARIWECLVESDVPRLRERLHAAEASDDSLRLNFEGAGHSVLTLDCRIARTDDHVLLLGEPLIDESEQLNETLLRINNELSTLTREQMRSRREVERTADALRQAHEELQKTHQELETS